MPLPLWGDKAAPSAHLVAADILFSPCAGNLRALNSLAHRPIFRMHADRQASRRIRGHIPQIVKMESMDFCYRSVRSMALSLALEQVDPTLARRLGDEARILLKSNAATPLKSAGEVTRVYGQVN
jgi:hypothetical protein